MTGAGPRHDAGAEHGEERRRLPADRRRHRRRRVLLVVGQPGHQPGLRARSSTRWARPSTGDGKYWIAPFAPGFDARLVGGTSTVDREDGQTLRTEYAAAVHSSPDVLGLISWNEFSENSYVEPSQKFGTRYLDVVRELRTTPVPQPPSAADSSARRRASSDVERRIQPLVRPPCCSASPLLLVAVRGPAAPPSAPPGPPDPAAPIRCTS